MEQEYDFFNKTDKHFFAGLFNTALNNFDLSLTELNKRMNYKEIKGNEKGDKKEIIIIEYAFNKDERTQLDFENNFNYLSESLIFLNRIPSFTAHKNKNGSTIILKDFLKDFLCGLYKTLLNYRNYYTHFEHDDVAVEHPLIAEFLEYILFNSVSRIKDDRVKTKAVKDKLLSKYKDDYNTIIEYKNKWTWDKNKELKEEGKTRFRKINNNTEDGYNYVLNSIFRRFIDDSTKAPKLQLDEKCSTDDGLTKAGFIQFLALFLNKRQVSLLFDNITYTKYTDTQLQRIITRWIYTYESYRDISYLFKSEYDKHALLLQMVSELTKCPKNLYPYLSEKDKDNFLEDINIYFKESAKLFEDDALVSHEVTTKRYEDKFPYFAIRFLDEFANFPTLRFQVNMGKFNHDSREKEFISTGKKTERLILENLTVFENLSEATKKKNLYFEKSDFKEKTDKESNYKDVSDSIEVSDWVEYPRPKYQFNKNTIGIWLDCDGLGNYDESPKRENKKPTKHDILDKIELKDSFKKPIAFLSLHELPALLYCLLIEKKDGRFIENRIKGKIKKQRKFLINLKDNYKYSEEELKQFPKKIRLILTKKSNINSEKIKRQIINEIEVDALKEIREKYTPKSETELSLLEKGKIATWLSKDIKRFVAKDVKGPSEEDKNKSWKGYQFSEFQALLSYYDIDKSKLSDFVIKDLNFNINKDFPFQGIVFSKSSLFDFYTHYLKSRREYLNHLLENFSNTTNEELLLPFKASKFKIKELEEYRKNKLEEPVMLARGIFDDKPTASREKDKTEFANWFTKSMDSSSAQKFYAFDKIYPLTLKVINGIKDEENLMINTKKGLTKQYKEFEEIKNNDSFVLTDFEKEEIKKNIKSPKDNLNKMFYKYMQKQIYKNEATIRKTMRNDYYMLQMIKTILKGINEDNDSSFENISLKDFYLTKAEKEKIQKNAISQSEREKGDTSSVIFNESYILNRHVGLSLLEDKIIGNVALKDRGKYKKLSQDKKVKQLTEYFDKTWSFEEIKNEISDYEHIRSKVFFNSVHELEEKIYLKAKTENKIEQLKDKEYHNFRNYLKYYFINDENEKEEFNNIKRTDSILDVKEEFKSLILLIEIRNKFAHNQLIPKTSFDYLTSNFSMETNERVASYLNRIFNTIKSNLLIK